MTDGGRFGDVTPLSASVLWELHRAWFEQEGVRAWSSGTVPSMITSNAVMGFSYAKVVVSFLREWADTATEEERRQPIYIVELGAGSGRFAYHFLRKLEPRLRSVRALRDLRITYVMTDFARSTIDAWRRHEKLAALVAEGRLDFAAFDASWPAPLRLVESGVVIDPAAPVGAPLVVVANYFIDGLPLDAFVQDRGVFEEHVVSVVAPNGLANVTSLDDIALEWSRRRLDRDRYGDPELDRLLQSLAVSPGDRTVLFPVTFFHTLRYLRGLSSGPLLLLSADKGWSRTPIRPQGSGPGMATHGSVSFMVDYSVIAAYVRQRGGVAVVPAHQPVSLATAAFVLDRPGREWSEVAQAFDDVVAVGGPDDFFQLKEMLDGEEDVPELEQILARLRSAQWDSSVFIDLFPALAIRTIHTDPVERVDVHDAMRRVHDLYFPIGELPDVPFCIAAVLWRIGDHPAALRLLEWSQRPHEPDAERFLLAALCHRELGDLAAAWHAAVTAVRLEPRFELAAELLEQLRREAGGEPPVADDETWASALVVTTWAPGRPMIRRMAGW